jgi:hypothetical protein
MPAILASWGARIIGTQNRAGEVAQVVEHLPSRCEAPSSNPSATHSPKKKEKNLTKANKKVKIWEIFSISNTSKRYISETYKKQI